MIKNDIIDATILMVQNILIAFHISETLVFSIIKIGYLLITQIIAKKIN